MLFRLVYSPVDSTAWRGSHCNRKSSIVVQITAALQAPIAHRKFACLSDTLRLLKHKQNNLSAPPQKPCMPWCVMIIFVFKRKVLIQELWRSKSRSHGGVQLDFGVTQIIPAGPNSWSVGSLRVWRGRERERGYFVGVAFNLDSMHQSHQVREIYEDEQTWQISR